MKPKTKQEGAKYAGFVMMGRNCNCFDEAFKRNPAYDGPKYSPALSYAVFMHLAMAAKTEPTDDRLNKKITSTVNVPLAGRFHAKEKRATPSSDPPTVE